MMDFRQRMELLAKLRENSIPQPNGCRLWTGGKGSQGHGHVTFKTMHLMAHRAMIICRDGNLGNDEIVLQNCDNKACIEPSHLVRSTYKLRGQQKKRRGMTPFGERNASAKLTWKTVEQIREEFGAEHVTMAALARKYGISRKQVSFIIHNKAWIAQESQRENTR